MEEKISRLPSKEESLAHCEVGVNCSESGECFLATIRESLTATAITASVMDEITPDVSIMEKAAVLRSIESGSVLAKCGITLAAMDIHPESA